MKLVFPLSNNSKLGYAFIGKTGMIRFNQEFARVFKLKKGDRWKIGYDEDDEQRTYMYFCKTDDMEDGITMQFANTNFFLSAKRFTDLFKVKLHAYYEYERVNENEFEGFRLKIVSNPLFPKKYSKK